MEKHLSLVAILNIVYRSTTVLGAFLLFGISLWFGDFLEMFDRYRRIPWHTIPPGVMEIVPIILFMIALVMLVISAAGIAGAIGVLKRKAWGRVLLLVVSFFNLLSIPIGTTLGIYSIWVLMSDETIRIFTPAAAAVPSPGATIPPV